ncbi:MAG: chemotaxis protein CheW [Halorhodospira halophila]|uniref:chemotaxis protein CheW n=1 Tax=Halorhodospira TaxID=85108 RepID=UPI001912720C|nr:MULTISPECIES: chemotaxis protein CheW [Halorhodospira]MBK5944476.1 chemotaxis protein CheW [Halorhodospira halophila]MCC3750603.1 chemotaxis protein CheW [Halorhodospira halophila]MCG5527403.1 chemotaxis protein CheW [Halorhodospira halophila]MCG5532877.1 chemotaxis protein CheW [Halorhodospira sp. 9621]MCG5538481.1 chemotaxis protein CheW [Halorhodospira sp. 9622]
MQAAADGDQYLTFTLGEEEYGVDILRVQEIKGWQRVTPIPNTPHYVKGVINLRGTIVPVIDLRERFGMSAQEYSKFTVVVMVRVVSAGGRERIMGLVVDALSEVYTFQSEQIRPAPEFGAALRTNFLRGLATVDDNKMVIILDVDELLSDEDLAIADDQSRIAAVVRADSEGGTEHGND